MGAWVNRTVLSGTSIDPNGTTSHTCTFTPATAGNLLVAIVAGSVTSSTPSGWTLRQSAVNNAGLYLFTKTASASESSFSTTHNASNYGIEGVVYEYYVGSTYLNSSTAISQNTNTTQTGPAVSSLTGTYTRFAARSLSISGGTITASCTWTTPAIEDYDALLPFVTNASIELTIAYDDSQTGASFSPSSNLATNSGILPEAIAFALSVASQASSIPIAWVKYP